MKLTENGPHLSPASRHVQPERSTEVSLWSPPAVLSLMRFNCPPSTAQYMLYEERAIFSKRALNGCVPERTEPSVGHQILRVPVGFVVVGLNEKELLASPLPPFHISKPASTSIKYQDD